MFTKVVVNCASVKDIVSALAPWLRDQGLNTEVKPEYVGLTSEMHQNTVGVEYEMKIPGPEGSVTLIAEEVYGYVVDKPLGPARVPTYLDNSVLFRNIDDTSKYVTEIFKLLLSVHGGYYADENSHEGMHGVPMGHIWDEYQVKTPKESMTLSWKEVFDRLGGVVQISDFEQYAMAAAEYQRGSERTSAFREM